MTDNNDFTDNNEPANLLKNDDVLSQGLNAYSGKMTQLEVLFSFKGRISLREFWLRGILVLLPIILLNIFLATIDSSIIKNLNMLLSFALAIPLLSLYVKRLHDRNYSGVYFLLVFIPLAGFWLIYQTWFLEGTFGENRFGLAPEIKEIDDTDVLEEGTTETEPSLSDNIVGIFLSPSLIFSKLRFFKPKALNWIIPTLLVSVIAGFGPLLMLRNPYIKYAVVEKQVYEMEKTLDEMVKKGNISPELAKEQVEQMRDRMSKTEELNIFMYIIVIIISIIKEFLKIFIIAAVFFLFFYAFYKGKGSYQSALVAIGLPGFILMIQLVLMVPSALYLQRMFTGMSISDILGLDKADLKGFVLSFIDPFKIWFYAVVSVGYSKLFKVNAIKSYGTVFGLWIGFTILLFVLAQYVPFLKFFGIGA